MFRYLVLVVACSGTSAPLTWSTDEAGAFDRARREHKGVMVEFYASWSVPCDELDRRLQSSAVTAAIGKGFVPLRIDVTHDSTANELIRERYGARIPEVVFVSTTGKELGRIRTVPEEHELVAIVEKATAGL